MHISEMVSITALNSTKPLNSSIGAAYFFFKKNVSISEERAGGLRNKEVDVCYFQTTNTEI